VGEILIMANQNLGERVRAYLASPEFGDVPDHSLSGYWSYFHDRIDVSAGDGGFSVQGESGFYEPQKSRSIVSKLLSLASDPKGYSRIVIRQVLLRLMAKFGFYLDLSVLPTDVAFDMVMSSDPLVDPGELVHDIASAGGEVRHAALSPYRLDYRKVAAAPGAFPNSASVAADYRRYSPETAPSGEIHAVYHNYNIMNACGAFDDGFRYLEIGAGNGNLSNLLLQRRKGTCYIVDLPRTLLGSLEFLTRKNPKLTVTLPNEAAKGQGLDADLVFLTPAQLHIIQDKSLSLAVNTFSFQEMTPAQVEDYFALIDRVVKPGGLFFTANRVEKIPYGVSSLSSSQNDAVMRFADYPWRPDWQTIVYEICRYNRLVLRDASFIRVCRMPAR